MNGEHLAQIIFVFLLAMAITLCMASSWENAGYKEGYKAGYAQAKAGFCDSSYIACGGSDKKKTKTD